MKHIKMYKATFNHYFNDNDYHTVSTAYFNVYNKYVGEDGNEPNYSNVHYAYLPNPFIIREDEIKKYEKYGCGFKKLEYVGSIIEEDTTACETN